MIEATGSATRASAVVLVVAVVQTVMLARWLGPEAKGETFVLLLTATTVGLVVSCSLGPALQVAIGRREIGGGDAAAFVARSGTALAAVCLLAAALCLEPLGLSAQVAAAILVVPAEATALVLQPLFVSTGRLAYRNRVDVIISILTLAMVTAAVRIGLDDVVAVVLAIALARTVHVALYLSGLRGTGRFGPVSMRWIHYGLRQHGASVLARAMKRLDAYIILVLLGAPSVGVYSVASSMAELPLLVARAAHPAATAVGSKDETGAGANQVAAAANTLLSAMVVLLPVYALLFALTVTQVFGPGYATARTPMALLLISTLGLGTYVVLSGYLVGAGDPGALVRALIGPMVVNILLSLVLIPIFDLPGNAAATAIAGLLTMGISVRQFARRSGLPWRLVVVPRVDRVPEFVRDLARPSRRPAQQPHDRSLLRDR